MAAGVTSRHGETTQHARLKQLAFIWAQTHGFSACAMEVTLPRCRYRADVAGYRSVPKQIGSTAVFECKQALCDLRRDNCRSESAHWRFEEICNRRQVLEARLRTHYPSLHNGDSLFPSSIPRTSARSATGVMRVSCANWRAAKSALRLHKIREANSLPLREFVLHRAPRAIIPRAGSACRLGCSGRIKRHTYTRPQTNMAGVQAENRVHILHRIASGGNTELKSRTLR